MKKYVIMIMTLAFVLCGCNMEHDPEGTAEVTEPTADLWIVMDYYDRSEFDLVSSLVEDFLQEHEGVTVELENLPNNNEEREIRLEQLKVQILAGKGPDLYILYAANGAELLISDIELAMKNGIFANISEYYDADTGLEKDALAETVMDAGVYGDARYVLPLRYNFPVACVNTKMVDAGTIGTGLRGLTEAAESFGSQTLVTSVNFFEKSWLNLFPQIIDYEDEKVLLDAQELAVFLEQYRSTINAMGNDLIQTSVYFGNYTSENEFWAKPGQKLVYDRDINWLWVEDAYAVHLGDLNDMVPNLRIAKAEGLELAAVPMTARDGSLTAVVTYWGAVGASCDDPELAYSFLRRLLLKEYQWHNNLSCDSIGWPVYAKDAWAEMNADIFLREAKMGQFRDEEKNKRRSALRQAEMTESDFALLDTPIDSVRFPLAIEGELMEMIDSKLNPFRNPDAMKVDVETLAEDLIWELQWHLAEG